MDEFLKIVIYILIANIGYLIFTLIRQGFRHYCNYIAELLFLLILTLYLFLKGIAAGWVIAVALLGIFLLVFLPHLLQAKIDSLLAENLYDEIEPFARLKSSLAWSEPNSHLHEIAKISEEHFEHTDKLLAELRELLGRGEPYDGMTRLFLGMIHFSNRNFNDLVNDVRIPDKKIEEQSFEELLYLVRGYLETTRYEEAIEAQFALEKKIYEDNDSKNQKQANAIINRFVFYAFMGWKEEYDSFLKLDAEDLGRLPFELREFWRGVAYFYSGNYDAGEKMMRTVIQNLPKEEKIWHDFMMKRLLGMLEHKSFFDTHILAKLKKLHDENSQKLSDLIAGCEKDNKEIPMENRVTNILAFVTLVFSTIWIMVCDVNDPVELIKMGANGRLFWESGEYYRTISYTFIHAGWLHLMMNLIALRYFGVWVETIAGWPILVVIYFISGIAGGVFSSLCGTNLSVGASGGILGLMGAVTVMGFILPKSYTRVAKPISFSSLLFILVVNICFGLIENGRIDNYCHLGGLLAGMILAFIAIPAVKNLKLRRFSNVVSCFVIVGILIYCFVMHGKTLYSDNFYPKTVKEYRVSDVANLNFKTEIPKKWKIDSSSTTMGCLNVVGSFNEKLSIALGFSEKEPQNFMNEYIKQRSDAITKEDDLELVSVKGPVKIESTKNLYRIRWIINAYDRSVSVDDYFGFENDYSFVLRLAPSSMHIDDYNAIALHAVETLNVKDNEN